MRRQISICVLVMWCALAASLPALAGWEVRILHPNGHDWSCAYGSSGGFQAGAARGASTGGNYHAALWTGTAGSHADLHPTGCLNSYAHGASGAYQTGTAWGAATGGSKHAALWNGTAESWLDLNPVGYTESEAYGVLDGQQVGYAIGADGRPHAALWTGTAGSFVDLHPEGFESSCAEGVFGGAQVGGVVGASGCHAAMWGGSADYFMDLHPAGYDSSYAYGIYEYDQVGWVNGVITGNREHAALFFWGYQCVDLNPAGCIQSQALGVAAGQQVGWVVGTATGGQSHAALWRGSAESFLDLHSLLPAGLYMTSKAEGVEVTGQGMTITGDADGQAVIWRYVDTHPPTGTISINYGAPYTRDRHVVLEFTSSDDGRRAPRMRISEDPASWGAWLDGGIAGLGYELSAGDGIKTVYVQYKDEAGNISAPISDSIVVDTLPAPGWESIILHPNQALVSTATGVSEGQQVGSIADTLYFQTSHAGLWSGTSSSWVDLHPAGYDSSNAAAISADQQVGYVKGSIIGGKGHASLWSGSAASWVDLNPVGYAESCAFGVSDGRQVGYVKGSATGNQQHAALWAGTAGSWVSLHPTGYDWSSAVAISNGQQVGYAHPPGGQFGRHAGLWTGTAESWVDLNPDGVGYSAALGVSDGQQVGFVSRATDSGDHAALWSGTVESFVDLNPPGYYWSEAFGVSHGRQVGSVRGSVTGGRDHAGIWTGTPESFTDLHTALPGGVYERSFARSVEASDTEIWVSGFAERQSDDGSEAVLWHYAEPAMPVGMVCVGGGAVYINNAVTSLMLSAIGGSGTVSSMRFSNDNASWTGWESYATSKTWMLSAGDGAKTVYVQYRDHLGNTSPICSDAITLDSVAPTGSISVNSGEASTAETTVILALSGTDAGSGMGQMCFSEDGSNWSVWEGYNTAKSWVLTGGDGTKTVYVKYKDNAGNESIYNHNILLLTISAPSELTATAASSSEINLSWTDNSSDETGFRIERKIGVLGTWEEIATVGAGVTSYSNTGLSPSTEYYYRVRAYNTDGNSGYSNEANAMTLLPALAGSSPVTGKSLWRSQKNIVRLTFDGDITAPAAGQVTICEMLAGGTYGSDLSSGFTFTVENDGSGLPRILKIRENATALTHRKWYAVRNTGSWTAAGSFTVQYAVQVGDSSNDGRVLNQDVSVIRTGIPTSAAADDDRRDINGDGRILNGDASVANSKIPSNTVAKPSGH